MSKVISMEEVSSIFKDGMVVMAGGFMGIGTPETLVNAIGKANVKDITLITNDTAFIGSGVGPLVVKKSVKESLHRTLAQILKRVDK